MAVLTILIPGKVIFSKNPAVFTIETDKYVEDAGLACNVRIELPAGPLTTGETFTFVWDGETVVLTVGADPTTDAEDFGVLVGTDIASFDLDLRRNKKLNEDFIIYKTGSDVYLIAREKGTSKNLTATTTHAGFTITTTVTGTDPVVNADLRIIGSLYRAATTGITETLHGKFDAIPDSNNIAKVDLRDMLHSMLECEDVILNNEPLTECVKSHKRYFLRATETLSEGSVEQKDLWVSRGGLKFQDDAKHEDFFQDFFLVDQIYLTNKKDRKVHRYQKESLAVIAPGGVDVEATVVCSIFDVNGSSYDFDVTTAELTRFRKYSFACGQVELDILNVAASNSLADVAYWQVYLRSSDPGIDFGRGRNFYLVEKGPLDRVFTFENTMGWFDTVTSRGETETGFIVEKDEFEKLFPFWESVLNRQKNIQQKLNFIEVPKTAFSGYMSLEELQVWMEFLTSENVWLQDENISGQFFNAVNIEPGEFKLMRDDDYRYGIEFKYTTAMRENAYSNVPFV